eukprot:UC4_evm1s1130
MLSLVSWKQKSEKELHVIQLVKPGSIAEKSRAVAKGMAVVKINGIMVDSHKDLSGLMTGNILDLYLAKPKRMRGIKGKIEKGEFVPIDKKMTTAAMSTSESAKNEAVTVLNSALPKRKDLSCS